MRLFVIAVAAMLTARASCIAIARDRVLLSDLAGTVPGVMAHTAPAVIGNTPDPGTRRVITSAEIGRILTDNGVAFEASELRDICVERAAAALDGSAILRTIQGLPGLLGAEVDLLDYSRVPVPAGQLKISLAALSAPAGRDCRTPVLVRGEAISGGAYRVPIWARVSICAPRAVVRAARVIPEGAQITAEMVQAATLPEFPNGLEGWPTTVEQVAGKRTVRRIQSGEVLDNSSITSREIVARGQIVHVTVASRGIRLRFDGTAVSTAAAGEVVMVRDSKTGRTWRAKVQDRTSAVITLPEQDGL